MEKWDDQTCISVTMLLLLLHGDTCEGASVTREESIVHVPGIIWTRDVGEGREVKFM